MKWCIKRCQLLARAKSSGLAEFWLLMCVLRLGLKASLRCLYSVYTTHLYITLYLLAVTSECGGGDKWTMLQLIERSSLQWLVHPHSTVVYKPWFTISTNLTCQNKLLSFIIGNSSQATIFQYVDFIEWAFKIFTDLSQLCVCFFIKDHLSDHI